MPLYTQHNLQSAPRRMGLGEYTGVIPWKPTDVGNCCLWLDASNPNNVYSDYAGTVQCSNGDSVGLLKAYRGGDARNNTDLRKPIYLVNQVNGYGGIHFGSVDGDCRLSASYSVANISTYRNSVALVGKIISINGGSDGSGFDYLYAGATGYAGCYWADATTPSTPLRLYNGARLEATIPAVFHQFTTMFTVGGGDSSLIRQSGINLASGASGTNNNGLSTWIEIGNYPNTSRGAEFIMMEMAVWNKTLQLNEIVQLESYWKLKYNLER